MQRNRNTDILYIIDMFTRLTVAAFIPKKTPELVGKEILSKYQPSGAGGTRSPPATPHRLQRRTACQWAPKWSTGSGKGSNPRLLCTHIIMPRDFDDGADSAEQANKAKVEVRLTFIGK